jgi:hypothetical protein
MILTYVDLSDSQFKAQVCIPDDLVQTWIRARREKKKLQNDWCRLAYMGVPDDLLKGMEDDLLEFAEGVKAHRERFWRCVDEQLPEPMRGGKGMIQEWWMPRVPE